MLVSIDTTLDDPSVILKSLLAPPVNTKSPPPLVPKFNGTFILLPADAIVFVLSRVNVLPVSYTHLTLPTKRIV